MEELHEGEKLTFEAYEVLCNQNNKSSRKSGILAAEIYDAAMNDPSTITSDFEGVRVPVLVDIKYGLGLGYDEDRAVGYAENDAPVNVLSVPVGDLDEADRQRVIDAIAGAGPRSIFYADNEQRDSTALTAGLAERHVNAEEVPLPNYRCRPENRQASLSLYVCDVVTKEVEPGRRSLASVQEHFDTTALPHIDDKANATLLKNGTSFTPEELEDLWRLYEDKFEFLGENHPISMEDTREDFLALISDESVMVSIRYMDNKPVCFTYFTENPENLYWLNQSYLKELGDDRPDLTPLFFPGIVSSRAAGNHAAEVISLFTHEASAVGLSGRIIFENTNLSEMYVPRIVQGAISQEPNCQVDTPQKVDQTVYRLLSLQ